jgi:hypothetical protein
MSQNVAVLPIDPSPWGRARKDHRYEWTEREGRKVRVHRIHRTIHPADARPRRLLKSDAARAPTVPDVGG